MMLRAKEYRDKHGFSVIPVNMKTKKPMVKWGVYQTRYPTDEELEKWFGKERKGVGIGIVTGPISGILVLDIDPGHDPVEVEKLLSGVNTPSVATPRGGRHYYFKYPEGKDITIGNELSTQMKGVDFRGRGGYVVAPPSPGYKWLSQLDTFLLDSISNNIYSILVYTNKDVNSLLHNNTYIRPNGDVDQKASVTLGVDMEKFFGQGLNNTELSLISQDSDGMVPTEGDPKATPKRPHGDTKRPQLTPNLKFEEGSRDVSLFTVAYRLFREGLSEQAVADVILRLAATCDPVFPEAEAIIKVQSALQHYLKKSRDISAEIRDWISWNEGEFTTDKLFKELDIRDRQQKKAGVKTLQYMVKTKELEKGARVGSYKIRDEEMKEMDFINADNTGLPIRWPLEIEAWAKIMPKNIIIIAGEVNSGKTAFCLNVAHLNKDRFPVRYFSSEMGEAELKERLLKFEEPLENWTNMKFYEREGSFADVIDPDGINIIDFLELHDDFFKAGGYIKQVFDRLNNGIAIIALQKNPGRDMGLGGHRSQEKARLYLAMEFQNLKIVKAKNFANPGQNPNGLERGFVLHAGCKFRPKGLWQRKEGQSGPAAPQQTRATGSKIPF